MDFAENYQFTIQDEILTYHWTKTYCTVHPVVIHVRDGGTVKVDSMCFLSYDLSHDISFVARRLAYDEQPAGTRNFFVPARLYSAEELSAGCYVACSYDNHWWIGIIECVESADAQVNFLHPHGPSTSFHWPARQDSCWVPFPNKILKLSPPDVMTSTGRQFCFPAEELKGVQAIFVREW